MTKCRPPPTGRLYRLVFVGGFALAVVFAADVGGPLAGPIPVNPARPDEWPMFGGGPRRNMVNLTARNLPAIFTTDPEKPRNIKWTAKLGSRTHGGPVVAGGRIYVGTNNNSPRNPRDARRRKDGRLQPLDKSVLMCFRESTGEFLWQHVNDKLPSGQANDWEEEGIASTPAVEGDRVYYVTNRCELVCLDANGFADGNQGVTDEQYKDPTDADVIWRLDMLNDLHVFPHNLSVCSPLIVGDLIFVVTGNGIDADHEELPSPDAPSFLAVNKHTGKVVWQSSAPGLNIMHGQWGHPAYPADGVPQVIFPGGDGWLYSFDPPTGRLLWKFDANPKDAVYTLGVKGTKSDFLCAPAIHEGRLYIGTGQDPEHSCGVGHLWCIDLARALELGRTNSDHDVSPRDKKFDAADPANRFSAFVWHFGGMHPEPGAAKRDFIFGRTMSTCAVHDGLCYAADLAGYVYCLDAKTGRQYWVHDTQSEIWGSPYWADGKVYLGTCDDEVWVFQHGRTLKVLAQNDIGKQVKTPVVAVGGVLYIATEGKLLAIAQP